MQPILKAIIYTAVLAIFTVASPLPDGDYLHIEGDLQGRPLSDYLNCPAGWTIGVGGTHGVPTFYCFNCGLQNLDILGCNPGCGNGTSCSAYASTVCGPFSGHVTGAWAHQCSGVSADSQIFPSSSYSGKPVECHRGGKKNEVVGSAYYSRKSETIDGSLASDACGFLLNNCPEGLHDQAVIYYMGNNLNSTEVHTNIQNNDFGNYSSEAVKLSKGNSC